MKMTNDVCKYAANQAISEGEAIQRRMAEKSKGFVEKAEEAYVKI